MSYNYVQQRGFLFTEDGQVMFLKVRDRVGNLLHASGAFKMGDAIRGLCGDSWHMLACVDRLVELREIYELQRDCSAQDRVFVKVGGR